MSKKKKKFAVFLFFYAKNVKKKIFKKLSIRFEIYSKNHIFRYYFFHRNKWGITSKKKKNSVAFYIFLCEKFWEKNFQKIKYQLEISSKKNNTRYKYFHMKKLGTTSEKKKKIAVFFIFLCKKFWEKDFQKIKYQIRDIK